MTKSHVKRQDESSDSRLRRNSRYVKELERETGFEPATSTLARLHSTTELLPRTKILFNARGGGLSIRRQDISPQPASGPSGLSFRKIIPQEIDLHNANRVRQDGHDIVAPWFILDSEQAAIDTGGANDAASFGAIDGCFREGHLGVSSGFNFDQDEGEGANGFVIGDEVDLAEDLATVAAMSDRGTKSRGHDPVAVLFEEGSGGCLAP